MPFFKFHRPVRVKAFIFLEINILRAISRDLFVITNSIMPENNISRFSEGELRGALIGVSLLATPLLSTYLLYLNKSAKFSYLCNSKIAANQDTVFCFESRCSDPKKHGRLSTYMFQCVNGFFQECAEVKNIW